MEIKFRGKCEDGLRVIGNLVRNDDAAIYENPELLGEVK